ncbi:MAG: hypothetical protein ACI85N_002264, partial [Gammaproteobacteria bacterium]
MQHLNSNDRGEDVDNETKNADLLHRNTKSIDVG